MGNLKIISDSRICSIFSKGPKFRLPSQIDFNKCKEEIVVALNEFCKRCCRRENVECITLNSWKLSIFTVSHFTVTNIRTILRSYLINLNFLSDI